MLAGEKIKFSMHLDITKNTNDVYCAGVSKATLLTGLKWTVSEPADYLPSIYRAPTIVLGFGLG